MSAQHTFYSTRAAEARADAERATLENVRDRWLLAAAAWDEMAKRVLRTETHRAEHAASKAAGAHA